VSSPARTIRVELGERSYPITIGSGNLSQAGAFVRENVTHGRNELSRVVIVTDENVNEPHATIVAESLTEDEVRVDVLLLEPGEQTKSVDAVDGLWQALLEIGADRKTVVVAVGGGVIGDLAGFVAATFARGLRFLQVPTTLLAQVDSSVGGKVGVNLPDAKNMVGAFWQPRGVLIDTRVLATLPEREYIAGLAEVVKYGVILDGEFFNYLEMNHQKLSARDDDVLRDVITRSCELKAAIVSADERDETGRRAVLNYGHTFGHAIETLTGYGKYLHGEAVAIGMVCAARLAERLGRIDASMTKRQIDLLGQLGLPVDLPSLEADAMLNAMARDKKTEHGRLNFILPSGIGHVDLVGDVSGDDVRAVLSD